PTEEDVGGDRNTPADAGTIRHRDAFKWKDREHPRRCGDNQETLDAALTNQGTPPQMRGL
ncbi:MAG: hypothetical protein MJZ68_10150, partial [archaeon]|nr:hypothetical protein [archaeon]